MLGLPLTYRKALEVFMIRSHLVSEAKIALYGKVQIDWDWLSTFIRNSYDHEKIDIFECFSLIIS